jgi:hypothetical protein
MVVFVICKVYYSYFIGSSSHLSVCLESTPYQQYLHKSNPILILITSTLKKEAVRSLETFVNFSQITWYHIIDDRAFDSAVRFSNFIFTFCLSSESVLTEEAILDNILCSKLSLLLHCNIKSSYLPFPYLVCLGCKHFLCKLPSFHG